MMLRLIVSCFVNILITCNYGSRNNMHKCGSFQLKQSVWFLAIVQKISWIQ
jgi:hypothetical protein